MALDGMEKFARKMARLNGIILRDSHWSRKMIFKWKMEIEGIHMGLPYAESFMIYTKTWHKPIFIRCTYFMQKLFFFIPAYTQPTKKKITIYFLAPSECKDVVAVFFSVGVNWFNSIDRMNKVHGNAGILLNNLSLSPGR